MWSIHVRRQWGYSVAGQDVLDELPVAFRDHGPELVCQIGPAQLGTGVRGGDDDVDAIGPASHVVINPAKLNLELLGAEGQRAEHAHPAGTRDRRHHVAAVAEREQRHVDAEYVAELGAHLDSSCRGRWSLRRTITRS